MKKYYNIQFIKIDLDSFETIEELIEILISNKISTNSISPKKVFKLKNDYSTLFYDKETLYLVGYIKRENNKIFFVPEFYEHLKSTESLSLNDVELSIDSILDKINLVGFESLNKKELDFLEKNKQK